jgi:ribosome maturation protein SDO1
MLKQPVGFKKLTNVAIIRLKKGNSRFEIACYKNKALDWRNGKEENLDEVLQIDEIFCNTEKGDLAKWSDTEVAFPRMTKRDIIIQVE